MKQPREDITGTPLSDDLLSLDEAAVAHRDALIGMARLLQRATLVGNPAPVVSTIRDRIDKPVPGDLVVECTRGLHTRDPDTRLKALGILIETRTEWADTDEEWAALVEEGAVYADEERITDTAWYVQYGPSPADVCRWTNCDFIALPYDWEGWRS